MLFLLLLPGSMVLMIVGREYTGSRPLLHVSSSLVVLLSGSCRVGSSIVSSVLATCNNILT